MKKRGRPAKMQEVILDTKSEIGSITLNYKNWVLNGTGTLKELQELIDQLKGIK